jgi:hypothetical protein
MQEFRVVSAEECSFAAATRALNSHERCWLGSGEGRTVFGKREGLVGPKPTVKLCCGALTLMPSAGFERRFPIRWFSDHTSRELDYSSDRRVLTSFSVSVGDALDNLLRVGDTLTFSRDGNGDFRYSVTRDSEMIFIVGSVPPEDAGGPFAVFQVHDYHPNPNAEKLKRDYPMWRVAEEIPVHRAYVSVRVNDQLFHLYDQSSVDVPPYFIFLARSNRRVPIISFEFTPRAVHAAGDTSLLSKDWIIDAAMQQTAVRVKML